MSSATIMRVIVLALTTMLLLVTACGSARAEDHVAFALRLLCGARGLAIAPIVQQEAEQAGIEPLHLASLIAGESPRCRSNLINPRTGAVGLGQILPVGSANPAHLSSGELEDPATNIRLTARHLAACLQLCGAFGPAVGVYHGGKRCRTDAHARKVLRLLPDALERWMSRTMRGR